MSNPLGLENDSESTARWSLALFGGFDLSIIGQGDRITLSGKRERILLAYLALSPNCRQSRRKMATLLWGDAADETTLDNLRTCVWALRKTLGDTEHRFIVSDGEDITLACGAFELDVWTFCRLATCADRPSLERAAVLYTGELLDGLNIESEEYETWRRAEATKHRDNAINVLTRLMTLLSEAGEPERAIEVGQRIVTCDSLHEAAVRHLMFLYNENGRRGAAIQLYRSFANALKKELGAEPEPETRLLFKKISQVPEMPDCAGSEESGWSCPTDSTSPINATDLHQEAISPTANSPATKFGLDANAQGFMRRIFRSRAALAATAAALAGAIALLGYHWLGPSNTSLSISQPDRVPGTIVGALKRRLDFAQGEQPISNRDIDPASYQQYLYARALVRGRMGVFGARPMADATAQLEQIVARHSAYAPAWALLARVYELTPGGTLNPGYQFVQNDGAVRRDIVEELAKAEAAAHRAIQLDANNADAYLALGSIQQRRGKLVEAEELISKALQLVPDNPDVLNQYSALLGEVGRPRDALSMQQHLHALETFVPNISMSMARFLWLNGENEAAIEIFKTLPEGRSNNNVARVYASMGRYSEAASLLAEDAVAPNPPEWTRAAAQLLLTAPPKTATPETLPRLGLTESYIYAYVGAPGRVLEPYEEIAETGYAANVYIAYVTLLWHPAYSIVRKTERFKTFARKAGFVDY